MTPQEALKIARGKNMDLVEVSPTAQPPVCRILDFGKYLYQQEKKEREAKKHQKVITVKEVKFRINGDDHDYETKKNHVLRFLGEGDKEKAGCGIAASKTRHRRNRHRVRLSNNRRRQVSRRTRTRFLRTAKFCPLRPQPLGPNHSSCTRKGFWS